MVRSLSPIEAAEEFWRALPPSLERLAQALGHSRDDGELTDSALLEHVRVVESGLLQLGREAAAARCESSAEQWLRRAARIFEISSAVVGRAVALKSSSQLGALSSLEFVAYELEILCERAVDVLHTLAPSAIRGAA